jgi:hypothetical protein
MNLIPENLSVLPRRLYGDNRAGMGGTSSPRVSRQASAVCALMEPYVAEAGFEPATSRL